MANANALLTAGTFNTYLAKLKQYIDQQADNVTYSLAVNPADATELQLIETRVDSTGTSSSTSVGEIPVAYVLQSGSVTTSGSNKYIEFSYSNGTSTQKVQIPYDVTAAGVSNASDVTVASSAGVSATNAQAAIAEIFAAAGVIKSYTIQHAGERYTLNVTPGGDVGHFDLGNDLVISSAVVEECTISGTPAGFNVGEIYLKVILSDTANTTLYVAFSSVSMTAENTSYSNSKSGMTATTVQGAIDEFISTAATKSATITDIEEAVQILSDGLDEVVSVDGFATDDDINDLFP